MRLSKLEIKGFKSFAKETVLHFGHDVIGVVGPNGSGKSNIVDAIRWVLGEQKKGELRLDKMSSVIFNGTKKRKAGNVAQVFLTFDNDRGVLRSEFETVTIGRLLYRNGDSEYRLNGVPCRRKDITELFVDTGIESNSYAIIALGMVDDILADKDNSRLRMLEQAAGISVYKVRKKETLNRLGRTQEDLDRVEDLLHEIDANLKDLEKQARRTKRYFEIKEQYRELSLDYAYASSASLQEDKARVSAELDAAEVLVREQSAEAERLETLVETTKRQQLTEEQHLAERRRQLGAVASKLRAAVNERQLAQQKIEYLSQNREKLGAQRERLERDHARLRETARNYEARLATALREQDAHVAVFERAKAALAQQQEAAEAQRGALRAESQAVQTAERQLLEVDRRIAQAQSRLDAFEHEATREARQRERDGERLTAARAELENAEQRNRKVAEQLATAEERESTRAVDEQRLRDELDELAPRLREARGERQRVDNELGLLQAMLDRMEGSPEAIKFLATKQGWRDRFEQLSDVVEVAAEYKAAVEALLAPVLTAFVVPDRATAAEGLRLLAEAKQQRTPILVYGDLPEVPEAELTAPEGSTPALSVVTAPREYRRLLEHLLAGAGVTHEEAARVRCSVGQRVVDLLGRQEWTVTSGRGGAVSRLQGKQTGRRKQAKALAQNLDTLSARVAELDAERERRERALAELRGADDREQLRGLRRRAGEAERLLASAQARVEGLEVQLEEQGEADTGRAEERAAIAATLAEATAARGPLLVVRDDAAARQAAADVDAAASGGALASASAAYNEANLTSIRLENTVVAVQRELDFAREQLGEIEQTRADSERALSSDGSEIGGLETQIAELTDRIDAGKATRDEQERALKADEQAYFEQRTELTQWEKSLRDEQRKQTESTALRARLRERRTELDFRMQNLRDRLRIEFNLDLDEAIAEEREVSLTLGELEPKIAKLKHRLDNYGEINPLAVEAFDAMNERHGDISGQRGDILQAMDDLRETLEEIDKNATEKLTSAFEAVRGHFVEVFRHLFDAEDTADMIMLDPENPLESKIEIVAKPKGKRPQTISQLSGGEKTLTATAFLFALYLIKPAPFCIFDEVDAPLDDSNVEKFNRIIKRFSTGSQFIIVTHNKLTMAAVDTIYGVYMPELGVSAVAPVDFRDFEHSDVLEMVG